MQKRFLVTGGAGFLGSHLCDLLLSKGHRVLCVDNYTTGHQRNIEHLLDNPGFTLENHDLSMPFEADVDEIFNLACPASPIHYQEDRIKTLVTNIVGASNMLQLARSLNCRIFQASSSEVYGDPEVHPQTEEYWGHVNPIGPRACYDEGKRSAETLFFDFHRQHQVDIKVARIFNTYGPRTHPNDGRVVSNFVVQALKGEDLTVYGDGSQTRSFCYVSDLIDGIWQLMQTDDGVTGPFNLGNPAEFTIRQLAELVLDLTGSKSKLLFHALPVDDPVRRRPDISKAHAEFGWHPNVSLREGLQHTISYFDQLLSSGDYDLGTRQDRQRI